MLITFTGRKSGRVYTTPVRYLREGAKIRCFTASTNKWWRNLRGGADITLRVSGRNISCRAEAFVDDPAAIRPALQEFLSHFPQDAAYYDIHFNGEGNVLPGDLERASMRTVMVEAGPCS
jgi:hypothetical protein